MPSDTYDPSQLFSDRVYAHYRAELKKFFLRSPIARQNADDLVQTVFARLLGYRGLSEIGNPENFIWWLAWRVLYSERERQRRAIASTVSLYSETSEVTAEVNERMQYDNSTELTQQEEIMSAISKLTDQQQLLFVLHYRDGLTYENIAELTGLSKHAVKQALYRAMRRLAVFFGAGNNGEQ